MSPMYSDRSPTKDLTVVNFHKRFFFFSEIIINELWKVDPQINRFKIITHFQLPELNEYMVLNDTTPFKNCSLYLIKSPFYFEKKNVAFRTIRHTIILKPYTIPNSHIRWSFLPSFLNHIHMHIYRGPFYPSNSSNRQQSIM